MSEENVVAKMLGESTSPQGETTVPPNQESVVSSPGSSDGDVKETRYDRRVSQLANERRAAEAETQALRAELSELRSRLETIPKTPEVPISAIRAWADFSDNQLHEMVSDTKPENASMRENARVELQRRDMQSTVDKRVTEKVDQYRRQFEMDNHRRDVLSGITSTFGETAADQTSDLYRRANEAYADMQRVYGEEAVASMPELQELAFHRASQGTIRDRFGELEELREYKRRASSEVPGRGGVRPMEESLNQKLEQGDTQGALSGLADKLFGRGR